MTILALGHLEDAWVADLELVVLNVLTADSLKSFYTQFSQHDVTGIMCPESVAERVAPKLPFLWVISVGTVRSRSPNWIAVTTHDRFRQELFPNGVLGEWPGLGLPPMPRRVFRALLLAQAMGSGWVEYSELKEFAGMASAGKNGVDKHTAVIRAAGFPTESKLDKVRLIPSNYGGGHPLIQESHMWHSQQPDGTEQPLVVWRQQACEKSGWAAWDFSVALFYGELRLAREVAGSKRYVAEIDIGGPLGIYRNRAKQFLRLHFEKHADRLSKASRETQDWLLHGAKGEFRPRALLPQDVPLRWASAGCLPLVRWRGRWWLLLFFRDIRPVGWNIACGASECETEFWDLDGLAEREAVEEIAIVSADYQTTYALQFGFRGAEAVRATHHRLRNEVDGLALAGPVPNSIGVRNVPGPCEIRIRNQEPEFASRGENWYLVVDAENFGVEAVKAIAFELPSDSFVLDGETARGDGKQSSARLVRQPVGLIALDALVRNLSKGGRLERSQDPHGSGSARLELDSTSDVTTTDIYLFPHDYTWRIDQEKASLHERDERWLGMFRDDFDQLLQGRAVKGRLATLCPVVASVVEQAFAFGALDVELLDRLMAGPG